MKTPSGADPLVRAGPPGPALWRSITFPAGRRGRRLRTRGSAPLGVFNGVGVWDEREEYTMSDVLKEVLAANRKYASEFGDKAKLATPPARRFAILTCMDARLDPAKFAG